MQSPRILTHSPLFDDLVVKSEFGAQEAIRDKPHNGVDLEAANGTPLLAVGPGVIRESDDVAEIGDNDGIHIVLQLDNGWRVGYGHLSLSSVSPGQRVAGGEVIGLSGGTGRVTGPHLHLTLTTPAGEKVDPMRYLGGSGGALRVILWLLGLGAAGAAAWAIARKRGKQ